MRSILRRRQPGAPLSVVVKAGLGAAAAIALTALLSRYSGDVWLTAPFGASCVLLFSLPASPLSQPVNVIGGHVASTLIGLTVNAALPPTWWSMSLAVGLAIAVMAALRITHPPAGADPLVTAALNPGLDFLLFPMLFGSTALVLAAALYHRVPPRIVYPAKD